MRTGEASGIGCVTWLIFAVILAFWTRAELSFWLSYTNGVPTTVEYWKALVVSLLVPVVFVLDVISFVVRMFV
jgi:hypothetical protein